MQFDVVPSFLEACYQLENVCMAMRIPLNWTVFYVEEIRRILANPDYAEILEPNSRKIARILKEWERRDTFIHHNPMLSLEAAKRYDILKGFRHTEFWNKIQPTE